MRRAGVKWPQFAYVPRYRLAACLRIAMFTRKTFEYFDKAEKHKAKRDWFAKNKAFYEENVREPFTLFLQELSQRRGR
jgi:uncharacterized protein (DUF2461 family)